MKVRIPSLAGEIDVPSALFAEPRTRQFVDTMVERGGMERHQAWRYAAEILVLTAGEFAERLGRDLGVQLARILDLRSQARQKYEAVIEHFARGRSAAPGPLPADLQPQAFRRLFIEMAAEIRKLEDLRVRKHVEAQPPLTVPFDLRGGRQNAPDQVEARLRQRDREDLADWFDDIPPGAQRDRYARGLAALSERELDGLQQIARLPDDRVSLVGSIDDILAFEPQLRRDLLESIADVAPHADDSLGGVLHGILQRTRRGDQPMLSGVQGSLGQLYAARHAIRALGATNLTFEVGLAAGRQVDIRATIRGERVDIEVKTPVLGPGFFTPGELMIDLVQYARGGYRGLRYLYPPDVDVAGLRARMRAYFDEPEVRRGLARLGIKKEDAEQAFDRWFADGVGNYAI